jgi:acyl dehydratase
MRRLRRVQFLGAGGVERPHLLDLRFVDDRLQPRFHVLAGMGWDGLKLPNAVRPGEELDLETTVLEMRESKSKSGPRPSFLA